MPACCSIQRAMRSPWRRVLGKSVHVSSGSASLWENIQGKQSGWQCKVEWWENCLLQHPW